MSPSETASADSKPRHSALVLSALILGAIVANMNLGIANVALPSIGRQLGASQTQLTAVGNAFTLGLACSVLYLGALGDKYGRKLLYLLGSGFAVPTAILAATSNSINLLIVARFLSGIAAGLLFPTTLSIVSALFKGKAQTKAIALWSGIGGGFAALGPLMGGLLLGSFWWGSVFLITVPIAVVVFVLGLFVLPKHAGEDAKEVDNLGGVLSVIAVASLVVALQEVPSNDWGSVGVLTAISIVAFVLFFLRQRRAPRPLVDLHAAKATTFWVAAVAGTITFGGLIGALFIGQQFTQNVLGYSALQAAVIQLPLGILMILTSVPAARMMRRFGGRTTLLAGLLTVTLAFAWMLIFWRPGAAIFHVLFAYGLVGAGVGLSAAPASKALMASLTTSRAGMGSAFTDLTRDFGGAVMNAVMGSALAIAYTSSLSTALGKLSPAQAEQLGSQAAQQIVSSYEGAAAVAERYPPTPASQILTAASNGFTEGKSLAVGIALLFTLLSVVLVVLRYPRQRTETAFFEQIAEESRREEEQAESLPS